MRVEFLKEDYPHFLEDPAELNHKLGFLIELHGKERIHRWHEMAEKGEWDTLVAELLEQHYDPAYLRSTLKHYPQFAEAEILKPRSLSREAMAELAREILAKP